MTRRIDVEAGAGGYPVLVERGLVGRVPELVAEYAPAHRYVVVTDENVAPLHADGAATSMRAAGLETHLLSVPAGEPSKCREEWARLSDAMLDAGMGRDSAVVAVGGGVVGDLAGFVAATFMRGIPVIHVPTSLVAMIDSSVGGKTGVDVPAGKNLVGAFHPPRLVVVDPELAATLPRRERSQGLAEALKHGAIQDSGYFDQLMDAAGALLDGDPDATAQAVSRSVEIKAAVVSADEREGGLRQILNFGHTLGHAVEAASDYGLGHGSAVAVGMILEARLGERLGVTAAGVSDALTAGARAMELDPRGAVGMDPQRITAYLGTDKKARSGRPRYVLLAGLGRVAGDGGWSRDVPVELVLDVVKSAVAE